MEQQCPPSLSLDGIPHLAGVNDAGANTLPYKLDHKLRNTGPPCPLVLSLFDASISSEHGKHQDPQDDQRDEPATNEVHQEIKIVHHTSFRGRTQTITQRSTTEEETKKRRRKRRRRRPSCRSTGSDNATSFCPTPNVF